MWCHYDVCWSQNIADMMCVHQIYRKYVNAEVDTIGPCEVFSKRNVCGNRHDGCVSGI